MNKNILILARNVIKEHFGLEVIPLAKEHEWHEKRATFVTLTINGKLRGCIGSLEARQSIFNDINDNALSAAFRDPRFPPLTVDELNLVKIEVSILTPLKEITFETEKDIINKIEPFKMGLLLEYGFNRGTFLPQVWDSFPKPKDFFNHLKQKAGLSPDFFNIDMKLYFYEVKTCHE